MVRYLRTGAREMWRDAFKPAFVAALRRYLPELRGSDLVFGPSGVRAQALDRGGGLLDDFAFSASPHVLHVRNAPSPAATASLAIGRHLAEKAREVFDLR
jgi:L-2-hydroxyglutarate oxidase LhgO